MHITDEDEGASTGDDNHGVFDRDLPTTHKVSLTQVYVKRKLAKSSWNCSILVN